MAINHYTPATLISTLLRMLLEAANNNLSLDYYSEVVEFP